MAVRGLRVILCLACAGLWSRGESLPNRRFDGEARRSNPLEHELEDWFPRELRRLRQLAQKDVGEENERVPIHPERQCSLSSGLREDCGSFGLEQGECLERGCCYRETDEEEVPWCYHPEDSLIPQCASNEDTRVECGSNGVDKDGCTELGCCWRPTSSPGIPWCYRKQENNVVPDNGEPEPEVARCGLPAIAPNVNQRIVGGVEATEHSWPWIVSLQINGNHFCGGSLINEQWVLTAAHCAPGFQQTGATNDVIVGLHSQSQPDTYAVHIEVSEVIPMQKYGRPGKGHGNDVMLLKLAHPVNYTDAVSPICLPEPFKKLPAGRRCYSTGWGHLRSGGESPDKLHQVMLPIIDNDVCNQEGWYEGEVDDTMVCAGREEGGIDTCQGDSGGPLVCYDETHWVLYGIVSWGHGCASENKPGLYGRVSPYLRWINAKMAEHS